jgi:heat shock protein HslJ
VKSHRAIRPSTDGAVLALLILLGLILLGLILAGCVAGSRPIASPSPNADLAAALVGRTFLSTGVTVGGVPKDLVPNTRVRLGFQKDAISANAGCNTFGAGFRIDGTALVVSGGAMTEMGCDEPRQAQDEWLFGLLGSRPTVALATDRLTLSSGPTTISLLDRTIAEPDLPLTGPLWTLESIVAGDAVSSVPAGVTATISFGTDGRIAVDSGCNSGSGNYTVLSGAGTSSGTLTVSDLAMTAKACQGEAGSVETAMLGSLQDGPIAFTIEASQLRLRAGGGGLDFRG